MRKEMIQEHDRQILINAADLKNVWILEALRMRQQAVYVRILVLGLRAHHVDPLITLQKPFESSYQC